MWVLQGGLWDGGLCPHQQCFGCEGFPCLLPALPPISALIIVNNNCHQLPGPTILGLPLVWPGQILLLPAALAEDEGGGEGAGHILPTAGIAHWGTQHRQGMLLSWGGSGPRVTLCCCLPISCLWRETPAEALVPQVRFGLSVLAFLVLLVQLSLMVWAGKQGCVCSCGAGEGRRNSSVLSCDAWCDVWGDSVSFYLCNSNG